ncbi:MAG TPA: nuclear transport factor 2 family protein [Solirubrobacterales bacterium]|nr:nuclear transport factor 2 family protein [Solirubrobacterales bacterium]
MNSGSEEAVVREFIRAFNERDLDAFAATLDPEVRLHSMKGLVEGIPAARHWATRSPGGVQQTVVINEVESVGPKVLVRIRRDWHWAEDGSLAGSDDMAWFFQVRDGRILSWRPFADTAEAFAEFVAP